MGDGNAMLISKDIKIWLRLNFDERGGSREVPHVLSGGIRRPYQGRKNAWRETSRLEPGWLKLPSVA